MNPLLPERAFRTRISFNRWGKIESDEGLESLLGDANLVIDIHYQELHMLSHLKADPGPGNPRRLPGLTR